MGQGAAGLSYCQSATPSAPQAGPQGRGRSKRAASLGQGVRGCRIAGCNTRHAPSRPARRGCSKEPPHRNRSPGLELGVIGADAQISHRNILTCVKNGGRLVSNRFWRANHLEGRSCLWPGSGREGWDPRVWCCRVGRFSPQGKGFATGLSGDFRPPGDRPARPTLQAERSHHRQRQLRHYEHNQKET